MTGLTCVQYRAGHTLDCQGIPNCAGSRSGQSLIEACLVMGLLCLLLMGVFQLSQVLAANEILNHAAARGVRAKTVGFNWWMVQKCVRVASIPNSGRMTEPVREEDDDTLSELLATLRPGELWSTVLGIVPSSAQYEIERVRIPEFMASDNGPRSRFVLDYECWNGSNDIRSSVSGDAIGDGDVGLVLHTTASQDFELWVPLHRAYYGADSVALAGEAYLENHYPLYMDDEEW